MVFNNSRLIYGLIILLIVIFSFIFTLDYFLYILIFFLIIYDLFYSKLFLNNYFLLIYSLSFIPIYFFLVPLININFFLFIFFLFFILSLFQSKYLKIYFLISILIFLIVFLNLIEINRNIIYVILFSSFLNDTSAYFFGKFIKGPKILPLISPNKTWSGTFFSFLISILLFKYFFNFNIYDSLILSLLFFLGDIYFSSIKRKLDIKDFSKSLKGHGGILDRLDSVYLSTFYIFLFMI